jgi:hypothetical protein
MQKLIVTALTCIACLTLALTTYTVAQEAKAQADAKAEFAAKVSAIPATKAEVIPAVTMNVNRVTDVVIHYGDTASTTTIFVAWLKGSEADGKFVQHGQDNITLKASEIGTADPVALADALVKAIVAKGKM